jgi:uncharacterized protein YmfQ (DUF2313 family)
MLWRSVHLVGAVSYSIVKGLASELLRVERWIQSFRYHQIPDVTVLYLDEWEEALAIPDDCFPGTGNEAERLQHIRLKLSSLGLQSSDDFVALAAVFGQTVTVQGGIESVLYPMPITDAKVARNTIVVTFSVAQPLAFTYTFPFFFGTQTTVDQQTIICLFTKLKPACNDIVFIYEVP